jgi:phage terminase small subunit
MGLRGPQKKALGLKLVSGTDQPSRRPPDPGLLVQTIEAVIAPPDWMNNQYARKEWVRLCPILVHNKILDDLNLSTFGAMCSTYGELIKAFADGDEFSPAISAQYIKYCTEFGLTPAARGKLHCNADAAPQNKFAKYKQDSAG